MQRVKVVRYLQLKGTDGGPPTSEAVPDGIVPFAQVMFPDRCLYQRTEVEEHKNSWNGNRIRVMTVTMSVLFALV